MHVRCVPLQAAGAAWVTDAATATLYRVDPATLTARKAAALDATPCELTAAFGAVSLYRSGDVWAIS